MNKKAIRQSLIKQRNQLQQSDINTLSKRVLSNLTESEIWKNSGHILFYASFKNEVSTHQLIRDALITKTVYIPKTENGNLRIYKITNWSDLQVGNYGILEPKHEACIQVNPNKIDLTLVPGVAFDKNGNRIGYGKGYYDKFLKNIETTTIGLAFDFQVVDNIPVEPFDIALNNVFTETRRIIL